MMAGMREWVQIDVSNATVVRRAIAAKAQKITAFAKGKYRSVTL
jgi:hypothetical protein